MQAFTSKKTFTKTEISNQLSICTADPHTFSDYYKILSIDQIGIFLLLDLLGKTTYRTQQHVLGCLLDLTISMTAGGSSGLVPAPACACLTIWRYAFVRELLQRDGHV